MSKDVIGPKGPQPGEVIREEASSARVGPWMGQMATPPKPGVDETPEEPALVSFAEFFEDDDLVTAVDRRNRHGSWLAS